MTDGIEDAIERSIRIEAPIERVWDLVSVPGWWINEGAALQLEHVERLDEARAVVRHPVHGDFVIERLAAAPPTNVSFRWVPDAGSAGLRTTIEFALAPDGTGTRLTVVERGFAAAEVDADIRRSARDGNAEGWRIELDLAAAHLVP